MPGPKQHHLWRWASLAAVITLLALCLILLGSHIVTAQEPSSASTRGILSPQADDFDLVVGTWNWPGYARPGGVFVYGIYYRNDDGATLPAEGVVITDTLPAGTTYADDTGGYPYALGPGNQIIWNLGTLDPGQWGVFMVTVNVPPGTPEGPGELPPNQAEIAPGAPGDWDPGNNTSASEPVDVWVDEVDVSVQKGPEPGDPTPGQQFQYQVEWCNNRGAAVGPVTLTDTLPPGTHLLEWHHNPWAQRFWMEVSASDTELILEAPGLPGDFCQNISVILEVDPTVPVSTTLENLVIIDAAGDVDPENNGQLNMDAHVSPPRADLGIEKRFDGGVLVPGHSFWYGINIWNQGNVAVNTFMTDTLPLPFTYQPGSTHLNGEPFPDPVIDGQELVWELGTIGVNEGWDLTFAVDIDPFAPLDEFGNCVEISHGQDEDTPGDNESCVSVRLWPPGVNLHVEKESQWNHNHINYRFFAANFGNVPAPGVVIIDTYPVGTEAAGEPMVPEHLQHKTLVSSASGQWIFEIADLGPGESGWFEFTVNILDPEARPAQFLNAIEISSVEPDINPADNYYEDQIINGEVERVELWLAPDGQSNMWGEAVAGQVVTVTTPSAGFTTTAGIDECPVCWEIPDTGIVNESDEITVESAGGLMPVVFYVPDPFTAVLDREAATVSGQIDHLDTEPLEVRGWWEDGHVALTTNASGEYTATYDAIPPGAEGVTYYETSVNYAEVTFRRYFRDMSLILQVNYDHDWIQGEYEVGHTVWLTVTKPGQIYTTTVTTDYGEGWEETGGFNADWGQWHPERPDLEPGDLVSGTVDNGHTAMLQIGNITGWVDMDTDSIEGTVEAPWLEPLSPLLDVECHPWGAPHEAPNKWSTAGSIGQPPYFCQWDPGTEWDIIGGQDLAVSYYEPDGHQVFGVFGAPSMRVNYGHDWVGGDYPEGFPFVITVTESDQATVKGVAEIESTPFGGWNGPGFETQEHHWLGPVPDILPGDWVRFETDGYDHWVRVGTIEGTVDVDNDNISGPIYTPWFAVDHLQVECHPWGADEGVEGRSSSAGPDGDPEYNCDWSGGEWDIVPGQDIGVMYIEPDDGDRVMNAFWEPAPDLAVNKGPEGHNEFEPGGLAVFWIYYKNDGDGVADPALLVDTLPPGAVYIEDSSGLPHIPGPGTVAWEISPVAPGEEFSFRLVVQMPPDSLPEMVNMVDILTDWDTNEDNNHAEASIFLTQEPSVNLWVHKRPAPDRPAPGSTYIYEIDYGNDGSVASGPVDLIDFVDSIYPGTTVVDWYSENGYDLWTEVGTFPNLHLQAPAIPARWSDRIILRLQLPPDVPLDTQLVNLITLGPAIDENGDAWTGEEHWNASVDKSFGWGILVPGGEVEYNIHVANHGNMPNTTWMTDTLPVGTSFVESWISDGRERLPIMPHAIVNGQVIWDLGEILPGAWRSLDVRLAIDPTTGPGSLLENCAVVGIEEEDSWPYDDESCTEDVVREPGPNLRVYKDYWWNGEGQLEYEIQFQNVGTEPLFDVPILDTLPVGTTFNGHEWNHFWREILFDDMGPQLLWVVSEIEPGWRSSIQFQVDLDQPGVPGLAFTNTVEADIPDMFPGDNFYEITAYTGPDVYAEKWLSGGEPRPGEIVTFTVKFGNDSRGPWGTDPNPDPPTTIIDTLPEAMTFITATAPWNPEDRWQPEGFVDNDVIWSWGPMDAGSWWIFDIVALITDTVESGDLLTNTITVIANGENVDPLPGNESHDLPLTILAPSFEVAKEADTNQVAGTVVTYTLTVTNQGNVPGTSVVLSDTLPLGLTYLDGDGAYDGTDVTWDLGSISSGGGTDGGWFSAYLPCLAEESVVNSSYGVVSSQEGKTASGSLVSFDTIAPTIAVTLDQTPGRIVVDDTVYFTATAGTNGTTLDYEWDFGAGPEGGDLTADYSWAITGTFTVWFTATDDCGFTQGISTTVEVNTPYDYIYLPLVLRNY